MTLEEMKQREANTHASRKPSAQEEHNIQSNCFLWFNLQYPDMKDILFSTPNAGKRGVRVAAMLKKEGMVSGVSDLILLTGNGKYHSLCIEMKTKKGTQRETQKQWQKAVEKHGNKYVICRSLEEFIHEIKTYLNGS